VPKYNILLDTSIYRQSPHRTDLPFQALERLCQAGVAQLHLPHVVEREFQTQQVNDYSKDLDGVLAAIDSLKKRGVSVADAERLQTARAQVSAAAPTIKQEVESALGAWADALNAERHPITAENANAAMEAYFRGDPPLTEPKKRADIPDSFIFQTTLSLSQRPVPLVAICADGKLAGAAAKLPNVTVYPSLAEFVGSPPIQTEMLELDVIKNLPEVAKVLEAYEHETKQISGEIESSGGAAISWKTFHSHAIPDDNHEASISSYHEPENVKLAFGELSYFGEGKIGLPFTFTAIIYATYYIFKADWYASDTDRSISVSDHNDHYVEAEEELEVYVSGTLRVEIEPAEVAGITTDALEDHATWEIDSIDDIQLIGEDDLRF
jgi:hypothetical protein